MRYVFAVDPGVVSGWAMMSVSHNPKVFRHGIKNFGRGHMAFSPDTYFVIMPSVDIMAIEDQYLGQNVRSLITLARSAGRWEEAARQYEIPRVSYVNPKSWITSELGPGLRREQIKIAAKHKVNALYGVADRTEHENCAILIGRYVAIQEARKGMI